MRQEVTTIRGEMVLLRPFREGDAEEAARVWTAESTYMYGGSRHSAGRPSVAGRQRDHEQIAASGEHHFAIETDGRYIGWLGLRVEETEQSGRYRIGIANPAYWGRGYGTEVTRLVLRYAFETLGLHRVHLRVTAYNARALRCYQKCGFRVEGVLRQSFQVDGEWQDDVLMAVLREEWEAEQAEHAAAGGGVSIRSYRPGDYPGFLRLWEACGFEVSPNDAEEVLAARCADPESFVLVAERGGEVVATVMGHLDRRWGWIQRLAVHPGHRRNGLGRRLVQEAEQRLAALGAHRAILMTSREKNPAAVALYEGLGYETWEQVIVMSRRLDETKET